MKTEKNATTREEMVCPYCFKEGLEPYPAFCREYENDERKRLKFATRCPECGERLQPEKAERQLGPKMVSIGPISFRQPNIPKKKIMIGTTVLFFIFFFIIVPITYGPIV